MNKTCTCMFSGVGRCNLHLAANDSTCAQFGVLKGRQNMTPLLFENCMKEATRLHFKQQPIYA